MEKIILSIILASSASSSLLVAENENRLEATNQVTGALSREQGIGNRGQVKNTNQATGDRLQGTGLERTELLSEDQIGQGAKTTTNYNNQVTGCRLQVEKNRGQATGNRLQVRDTNQGIEYRLQGTGSKTEELTANCDNSAGSLNCHLMMDPAELKNGTQAIGEAFSLFGKEAVATETAVVTGAGRSDMERAVASSNSFHQVLRLRGGGPKPKNKLTGGLKSAGESSDEENDPDLESEDTQAMGSEVSKYLKKEIINNIYTECLAEVAKLSLGGRVTDENLAKEEAEWTAAAQAAEYSKGKIERAFEKAEREIDEAKSISDEAKRNVRELEKAPKPASATEQAIAAANLAYEKAYAAYAATDYKAKKLAGELAEARVETANAVLHAITVRKGTQHATEAEVGLETAKEAELEALKAVESAKVDVSAKAVFMKSAEVNLNEAKRTAIGTSGTNPTPPMTAAQKVAMREIEEDKAIAEAAKSKAKKVELTANVAKDKIYEMNFERELKAYHDAEDAWKEAIVGYKTALAKVHGVDLDDEELEAALASAEVHQATWRAHARWVKARQADQLVATSAVSLDHLTVAEKAWANVVEGYKMAIEKAMQAKLKCVELTASLNSAVSAQESAQAQAIAFENSVLSAQKSTKAQSIVFEHDDVSIKKGDQTQAIAFAKIKATQAREKAAAAKIVLEETAKKKSIYLHQDVILWNRVICQLEKSSESWDKVSETLMRGNEERAALWVKAAEKESVSAEACEQVALAHSIGDKEKVQRLDKISWIAYHLSNADRWLAESEEALEKGHQDIAGFWRQAARDAQEGAEYERKAVQDYALGGTEDNEHQSIVAEIIGHDCVYYGIRNTSVFFSEVATYLTKAVEANDKGNSEIATLWTKGAEQMKASVEYMRKTVESCKLKKKDYEYWSNIAKSFWNSASELKSSVEALEKATAATAKGNEVIAVLWSKISAKHQEAAEHYQKIAEAKRSRSNAEADRWEKIACLARKSTNELYSAAKDLEKATAATVKGNEVLAVLWSKGSTQCRETAENYCRAAEAKSSGNNAEADRWEKVADSARKSTDTLYLAAEALEKATIATINGNESLAVLWNKTSAQYRETVEYYRNAAEAQLSQNYSEADHWEKVADFSQNSAYGLKSASKALEKESEATAKGNTLLAELWSKTGVQYKERAEHYRKAVEAKLSGNNVEVNRWKEAAISAYKSTSSLYLAANAVEEMTEAVAQGNQSLAELWNKTFAQYQESADYYRKAEFSRNERWEKAAAQHEGTAGYYQYAAEAKQRGQDAEADRWEETANSSSKYVAAQKVKEEQAERKKAEEAKTREAKRVEEANAVQAEIRRWKVSAVEAQQKEAIAKDEGKTKEVFSWNLASNAFTKVAETLEKVIEAQTSRKFYRAQFLEKAAKKYQQAAAKSQEAAEFRVEHPWSYGAGALDSEGKALIEEADAMVKKANEQS